MTSRDVLRPILLFAVSAALVAWTAPGYGGETFRALLVDGPLPVTLLGILLWIAVGHAAGTSPTRANLWYSLAAILAGAVAGRIIAASLAARIGVPFDSVSVSAAFTLGFTNPGDVRSLGSVGDPVWIRATAALLLPAVVVLGASLGLLSKKLKRSSAIGES